jgi:photosystem II stability/assembly factor-like uncharacterized protein
MQHRPAPKHLRLALSASFWILGQLFVQLPASLTAQPPTPIATKPVHALSWNMQDSGTTASLRGIYSVDGKTAWASGTSGTILKTIDGGAHWTQCAVPPDASSLDFRGIQAADSTNAIAMASGPGDKSRLYATSDGCKTWQLLFKNPDAPDGFFDSFFADWGESASTPAWSGSLLGDPVHGRFTVFDTVNSGASWTQRKSPDLALNGADLAAFAASNSLFPNNQDNGHVPQVFVSGGKGGAVLWLEKLPEHSWRRISLPIAGGSDSAGIFSIAARTESVPFRNIISVQETLIAVGGDYQKPNESAGTAAWSTDRIHWTAATHPPHGYRSAIAWSVDQQVWIAAGTNGSDISRDDGKTWQPLGDSGDGNWNALSLPFIVGPKGRIARLSFPKQ